MSILSNLRVYIASKWEVSSSEKLSKEDIKNIDSIEVVDSEFGLSACFHLKSGGQSYMPLSKDSELSVGDEIDPKDAKILTLSREGDKDIYRLEA